MKTSAGNDWNAQNLGDTSGDSGTSTAVTSTSLTDTGKAWTAAQWVGHVVSTGTVYGVVISNTTTALTVDRWYTPSSPGGAAASTPATGGYVITPGSMPAGFMALTATGTAPALGDTTLGGEITTVGGGLARKLGIYTHTTGAAGYTMTWTYTANGSDTLPVAVAKTGTFASMVSGRLAFEALVSTSNFASIGDQMVVTTAVSN